YVDVVFGSAASLEPGRRGIVERVAALRPRLPPNIRLQVGPPASSTGWIYQYALVDTTLHLPVPMGRKIQEELLRPALSAIPGVAEVASVGELAEELVVESDPDRLRARGVAFSDVVAAVRAGALGAPDVQPIEPLPLGASLKIGDVAHAVIAPDLPTGIADFGGSPATLGGIVVARRDADPRAVIERVERKLAELRPRLP